MFTLTTRQKMGEQYYVQCRTLFSQRQTITTSYQLIQTRQSKTFNQSNTQSGVSSELWVVDCDPWPEKTFFPTIFHNLFPSLFLESLSFFRPKRQKSLSYFRPEGRTYHTSDQIGQISSHIFTITHILWRQTNL